MASVTANGITIEYEDEGSGEPMLLVMGLSGQLIDWPRDFVDMLLAKGFRVIRFDNRDAGLSTEFPDRPPSMRAMALGSLVGRAPQAAYHLTDMADDAVALLDALGIERAHVVGVSMGGMIAQTIAIHHPDRVLSLVSIMSTTGNRRKGRPKPSLLTKAARLPVRTKENAAEVGMQIWRLISGPHFDEREVQRSIAAAVARSVRPQGSLRQTAAILAAPDRTAALGRVGVPTLVIHGMVDPLVQPSGGVATASAIHGSRLLMFDDMGHDLPAPRRQEIVDAIAENARRV